MMINYSREELVLFNTLKPGDVFYWNMCVWMKTDAEIRFNAVNLATGVLKSFDTVGEIVPKLKAMLYLNDNLND